jgi:large subunit ribosomal protein L6
MKVLSKKYVIKIPNSVSILYCSANQNLIILGSLGRKLLKIKTKIFILKNLRLIKVTNISLEKVSNNQRKKMNSVQGTLVALIKQLIIEVSSYCCKILKLIGIGFKVFSINFGNMQFLHFKLGYSHQIYFKIPENVKIFCLKSVKIFILGKSYENVSQIAAYIRSYKLPDSYKGKGILYENEKIKLKAGKKI